MLVLLINVLGLHFLKTGSHHIPFTKEKYQMQQLPSEDTPYPYWMSKTGLITLAFFAKEII